MNTFRPRGILILFVSMAMTAFTQSANKGAIRSTENKPNSPTTNAVANPYYIVIDKSDYELKVYDDQGWYATYPIVFGSKDLGDKMREGDKKTPDGHFKVIEKKIHSK